MRILEMRCSAAAALIRGDKVFIAIILLDLCLKVVEVPTAGVGFVTQHHACPLVVAHSVGAAVCEKVDVDVFRFQQECVVARVLECSFALCPRRHFQEFNSLDLEWFSPGSFLQFLHNLPNHLWWNGKHFDKSNPKMVEIQDDRWRDVTGSELVDDPRLAFLRLFIYLAER